MYLAPMPRCRAAVPGCRAVLPGCRAVQPLPSDVDVGCVLAGGDVEDPDHCVTALRLALPPAASASSSAGPLQLPEVVGLPPEPEAAGPLAAVAHAPRGYRLPGARRQPSWRGD